MLARLSRVTADRHSCRACHMDPAILDSPQRLHAYTTCCHLQARLCAGACLAEAADCDFVVGRKLPKLANHVTPCPNSHQGPQQDHPDLGQTKNTPAFVNQSPTAPGHIRSAACGYVQQTPNRGCTKPARLYAIKTKHSIPSSLDLFESPPCRSFVAGKSRGWREPGFRAGVSDIGHNKKTS